MLNVIENAIAPFLTAPWWQYELWSNTLREYTVAVVALVVLLIVFKVLREVVLFQLGRAAKKTKTDIDDLAISVVRSLRPPLYFFVALYFSFAFIDISGITQTVASVLLLAVLIYEAARILQAVMDHIATRRIPEEDAERRGAVRLIGKVLKVVLWIVGSLLILSNFGVNVSSLIASLGIGGIAVALAAQNILGDLFSSFSIYFDKPFIIGDTIIVGDQVGTVERIGIKTTRLRTLRGEELVIPNTTLTSTNVQNLGRMEERRVDFKLGVHYGTPQEKMEQIPKLIQGVIENVEQTRFDRATFASFDDSALTFEVIYYVTSPDWDQHMDILHAVNMNLKAMFEREGIDIAYPTRTVYLKQE